MIVTIDGPAGAGKSSVARRLAQQLGFRYLDTGAMYRAVTWSVLRQGVDPNDQVAAAKAAAKVKIHFEDDRVFVDRHDVTISIRNQDVTQNVSPIADNPEIREQLVELQREIASEGNFICEGRDQGTVAFPDAECKIFLVATPEERASRRVKQLEEQGLEGDYESILEMQNNRDQRDYSRPIGNLMKADDAIEVITDHSSLDEITDQLVDIIRNRIEQIADPTSAQIE